MKLPEHLITSAVLHELEKHGIHQVLISRSFIEDYNEGDSFFTYDAFEDFDTNGVLIKLNRPELPVLYPITGDTRSP